MFEKFGQFGRQNMLLLCCEGYFLPVIRGFALENLKKKTHSKP
jgi:hypothetical protein